jgi:hypothetical protein
VAPGRVSDRSIETERFERKLLRARPGTCVGERARHEVDDPGDEIWRRPRGSASPTFRIGALVDDRTSPARSTMAEAAAAEIEKMNVEGEKKEVVTALAGAFGVAPPIDTGCVREARRAREGKKESARS